MVPNMQATDRSYTLFAHVLLRARRAFVLVAGGALLLLGTMLLVLPGPGTPVLLGGLALLATEFSWADRLLQRVRNRLAMATRWRPSRQRTRDALALLGGTALIGMMIWGADEIGARLAS